jgi:hypothetical protein
MHRSISELIVFSDDERRTIRSYKGNLEQLSLPEMFIALMSKQNDENVVLETLRFMLEFDVKHKSASQLVHFSLFAPTLFRIINNVVSCSHLLLKSSSIRVVFKAALDVGNLANHHYARQKSAVALGISVER